MSSRATNPEPRLIVRAEHRDEPNIDQLSELVIRLSLQRAEHARNKAGAPRAATKRPPMSEGAR